MYNNKTFEEAKKIFQIKENYTNISNQDFPDIELNENEKIY